MVSEQALGGESVAVHLLAQLAEYQLRWPDETALVERFVEFVSLHQDCFERSLDIGHVTGSAWVVSDTGEQVLLTHHRKLNRWLQLGGHSDGDPHTLQVAMREVVEESGLTNATPLSLAIFDIDIHRIPARADELSHDHYDVRYLLQASAGQTLQVSDESHDVAWVSIDQLGRYTNEPSMLRMAEKWQCYQNTSRRL